MDDEKTTTPEPATLPEPFDLEAVYDDEVGPLMRQIIEICKRHKMQVTASFCFKYDGNVDYGHCTTILPGSSKTLTAAAGVIRHGVQNHQTVKVHPPDFVAFTITTEKADAEGGAS